MTSRACRLPVSAADALHSCTLLIQLLLLWFCAVLVAPAVLVAARDQGLELPSLVAVALHTAGWLLHRWWMPVGALVVAGAWLAMRAPAAHRPQRLRNAMAWSTAAVTVLASATVVATILGLVLVWRR